MECIDYSYKETPTTVFLGSLVWSRLIYLKSLALMYEQCNLDVHFD